MRARSERRIVIENGEHAATALECSTAFLALQIRQARGWILTEHAAEFSRGTLVWSYNFGFPAASLNDTDLRRRYQTCVCAAVKLSSHAGVLDVSSVRRGIESLRLGEAGGAPPRCELVAEIAGAVAGFAHSPEREDGLYAMVDVGAGTLDCCTFNLMKADGADRCPVFAADVSMLGVRPWDLARADTDLCGRFPAEVLLRQKTVIWETKLRRHSMSDRWLTGLPVFLTGGGANSLIHRQAAEAIDPWLRGLKKGGAHLRMLPQPSGLRSSCQPETAHRLSVAVGLSLPFDDIPKVELPLAIDDEAPSTRRSYEDRYPSK